MQHGGALGLERRVLDLERGSLAVRQTMSPGADSRSTTDQPKTACGRRQIALPALVVESLRRHRVRQLEARLAPGVAYVDHDLVFPNDTGGPLHPNTLTRRFRQLSERSGVPPIRLHDLRHTCATLMLANREHPKVVQERLGHADIAMTMNLYSHVTADMQRQAAVRLDALIGGHEDGEVDADSGRIS